MSLPEVLTDSHKLRVPVFEAEVPPRSRIDQLETHMLLIAFTQGQLNARRVEVELWLRPLHEEWANMKGWQQFRRSKTETGVEAAKRESNPALAKSIDDLEFERRELRAEIDRLELDSVKVSRAYSMITGN